MEAFHLPEPLIRHLSTWPWRILRLTSLRLNNTTCMHRNLGIVIAKSCPKSCKLSVIFDDTDTNDKGTDLPRMLSQLPRDTLQTFEISSVSVVVRSIFTALSRYHHANSLTHLSVSLRDEAFNEVSGSLQAFVAVRDVRLDFRDLGDDEDPPFLQFANWSRNCHTLQALHISQFEDPPTLLGFLDCNDIRLKKLVIQIVAKLDESVLDILRGQKEFEKLRFTPPGSRPLEHPFYGPKAVRWPVEMSTSLKSLDLGCVKLDKEDLFRISRSLLRSLRSYRQMEYSFEDIVSFVVRMGDLNRQTLHAAPVKLVEWLGEESVELTPGAKTGRHSGFRLWIDIQWGRCRPSDQQKQDLANLIAK